MAVILFLVRDIRSLSGPWKGFFVQGGRRGTMSAHLSFSGNLISGGGSDLDGSFGMTGEFFPNYQRVLIDKRYPELTSHYDGRWDGQLIAGHWSFSILYVSEEGQLISTDRGTFELWPLEHEHELDLDAIPMSLPEPEIVERTE